MQGRFITLEGMEGSGKSCNQSFIAELLRQRGLEVVETREPGGTRLGEELRELLLGHRDDDISPQTELLLMFAARQEHLEKVILPQIQRGAWVLCDRFTDSTFAYQGGGRQLGLERIATLEHWVQGNFRPDATILFDLPYELGLERAGRRSKPDRFETETAEFFDRVRARYLLSARQWPNRYHVIDASQSLQKVREELTRIIEHLV